MHSTLNRNEMVKKSSKHSDGVLTRLYAGSFHNQLFGLNTKSLKSEQRDSLLLSGGHPFFDGITSQVCFTAWPQNQGKISKESWQTPENIVRVEGSLPLSVLLRKM